MSKKQINTDQASRKETVTDATLVGQGKSGKGILIAGVGGNYEVALDSGEIFRVKARGIFRKHGMAPLIGDRVTITKDGFLDQIEKRKNELVRPAAANIDQIMIVFAFKDPAPHFVLLDRFLAQAERQDIPILLVFNKKDLDEEGTQLGGALKEYEKAGYRVMAVSTLEEDASFEELRKALTDKITVLAGPSGVGKSSLINALIGSDQEVGEISEKIARGKNTTRHARLLKVVGTDGWIADTPGFTSFYTQEVSSEELAFCYPEFRPYLGQCYYQDCRHIHEPGCAVKEAVNEGRLSRLRYENYTELFQELLQYEKEHPDYL